jgi:signal transduction histidine kinase/ActR/RegA family two-component response regulator
VLLAVAVSALARKYLLGELGTRIAYVTWYPAVMLAALSAGWLAGLLTTLASCLVLIYAWPFFVDRPFIADYGDRLGMAAFVFNCVLIAMVAESARRARERAIIAKNAAEEASNAKSVFLAHMSHELRTPLNAVLGFSSLMRGDATVSEEHRHWLDIINRNGEHLLDLLNNVLDLAKIEAGRMMTESTVFDVHVMLGNVVALLRGRAQAKGLDLRYEIAQGVPRVMKTDERKLRQVVINLLGNAIKFTASGYVTLRIDYRVSGDGAPGILALAVEDTGEGISPDEQRRLFEPFARLASGFAQGGTGLGLSITRQFVELLGGTVRVESAIGRGSTFYVEVPLPDVPEQSWLPQDETSGEMVLAPGQAGLRVLIVEDQADNQELLRHLMERAGFDVQIAANGAEGVEAFRAWRPHFIWMDWRMPVMGGLEATRLIRSLDGGSAVRIAALSASVFKDERQAVLDAGVNEFVAKPIRVNEVMACLGRQLHVTFESGAPSVGDRGGAVAPQEAGAGPVGLDALRLVPADLRADLLHAVLLLDADTIREVITRIDALDPALGAMLRRLKRQLRYTDIHRMLVACQTEAPLP